MVCVCWVFRRNSFCWLQQVEMLTVNLRNHKRKPFSTDFIRIECIRVLFCSFFSFLFLMLTFSFDSIIIITILLCYYYYRIEHHDLLTFYWPICCNQIIKISYDSIIHKYTCRCTHGLMILLLPSYRNCLKQFHLLWSKAQL